MKTNVVDDMGDEYFMGEYRNCVYLHEGKPYRLKGFNINGNLVNYDTRREARQHPGFCKEDFRNNKEDLIKFIMSEEKILAELKLSEPQQYEMYIDEEGEERESEDLTEDWESWEYSVQQSEKELRNAKHLLNTWDDEEEQEGKEEYLHFIPLFKPSNGPLLIKIQDFTSLKGFAIPQGFVNSSNGILHVTYRRAWRIGEDRALFLADDPKSVTLFTERMYPTLKEALVMLKDENMHEIAIGPLLKVVKEKRNQMVNEQWRKVNRWHVVNDQGDTLAQWEDGKNTLWAKNSKIMTILSKKG